MSKVYYSKKSIISKLVMGLCTTGILAGNLSITGYAETDMKTNLVNATYLLEDAIQNSLDEVENQIKKEIISKGLDYRMTMDSFYAQPNPYIKADYIDLITAYLISKEKFNTLSKTDLYSVPFVDMSIDETSITEYEPKRIVTYEEVEPAKWQKGKEVYIYEPMEVAKYKAIGNGYYEKTQDTEKIDLEKAETKYGEISLIGLSYKDIFSYYGIPEDEQLLEEFHKRKKQFETIVSGKGLAESVFITTANMDLLSPDVSAYIQTLLNQDLDKVEKELIKKAVSLVGKVPYEWGGKASNGEYDPTWFSIQENGHQKGLDCSGYVQWCFSGTVLFEPAEIGKLISTKSILSNTEVINKSQLSPGDLGLLNFGEETNHVGIYLGNNYWIHCSSGSKTVIVEQTDMFKLFRKMPREETESLPEVITERVQGPEEDQKTEVTEKPRAAEEESQTNTATTVYHTETLRCEYTEEDIYLLAQLVYNEANAEGLNGWIAVAEVVKNRVNSEYFPNTIREVIYQKNPVQFSNYQMIEKREPTNDQVMVVRQVLKGELGVLNNSSVLFFRNAHGSTNDWGSNKYYTSVNNHQFYTKN